MNKFFQKVSLILFFVFFSLELFSQQQKHETFFSFGAGASTIVYDLNVGKSDFGLGGAASVGYRYFFTSHMGISLGFEYAQYDGVFSAESIINRDEFNDPDFGKVNYEAVFTDYKETQRATAFNIPLMLYFQTSGQTRLYASMGLKLSLPQTIHFKQSPHARIKTTGYAPDYNLHLTDAEFLGYGNFTAKGDEGLQDYSKYGIQGDMNYIASCEFGLKIPLNRQLSLYTAAYIDYGLRPMLRLSPDAANHVLLSRTADPTQGAELANSFSVNPVLPSRYVNDKGEALPIMKSEKALPFVCGLKFSLSFGAGKRYDLERNSRGLYRGNRWWIFR